MAQTVIGLFDNITEAQRAVEQLVTNGFTRSNIDISGQNAAGSSDYSEHNDHYGRFFNSLMDNQEEAGNYSAVARRGSLVTVHTQTTTEAQRAAEILDQYGAMDVNERASQLQSGSYSTQADSRADNTGTAIPIIEEDLQVGKRVVETGGVRLRSRIIEKPVEETLRLREEHVRVEREAVNRPATAADLNTLHEETIEMREQAEVPVVNKEARVVEEITLGKSVEEREETIRDTVRRTDVEVDNLDASGVRADTNTTTDSTLLGNRFLDEDDTRTGLRGDQDNDSAFLSKSHDNWAGSLRRMEEVEDDYKVADDNPDVRGWDVIGMNGEKLGEVDELIVDTSALKVRYLELDLDDSLLDNHEERHVLVPIGVASLDYDNKNVIVNTLGQSTIASYPAYRRGEAITREYEQRVMSALSPDYQSGSATDDFYGREHFDDSRFYGNRNQ